MSPSFPSSSTSASPSSSSPAGATPVHVMLSPKARRRLVIRRALLLINFIFVLTLVLLCVLVIADFALLIVHMGSSLFYIYYVPWAVFVDWKTARDARRKAASSASADEGAESESETQNAMGTRTGRERWRVDKVWHETVFLVWQTMCWLASAIIGGMQAGPKECREAFMHSAQGKSALEAWEIQEICDGMTAAISISCIGIVLLIGWTAWTVHVVRSLRVKTVLQIEGTGTWIGTGSGTKTEKVVFEEVWGISISTLFRRQTRSELQNADGSMTKRGVGSGCEESIEMGLAISPFTGDQRRSGVNTLDIHVAHGRYHGHGPHSPETPRADRPPPPYTRSYDSSSSLAAPLDAEREGGETGGLDQTRRLAPALSPSMASMTMTISGNGSYLSPGGDSFISVSSSTRRLLPLAPPDLESVLERKMDHMASGANGRNTTSNDGHVPEGGDPLYRAGTRTSMASDTDRTSRTNGKEGLLLDLQRSVSPESAGTNIRLSTSTVGRPEAVYRPGINRTISRLSDFGGTSTARSKAAEAGFANGPPVTDNRNQNRLSAHSTTIDEAIQSQVDAMAALAAVAAATPSRAIGAKLIRSPGIAQSPLLSDKAKGKRRERAGSDPGPLVKSAGTGREEDE